MKKILQLIKPFRETRNIVALCLAFFLCAGSVWAQTDYSTTYTSGVTLSTTGGTSVTTCDIVISGATYAGLKAGTGKVAGAVQITVPENTKYFHMHIAAWNNESVTLTVTPTGYSGNIALTSNSGISNNSPFTFNGDASTNDYYKVITFSEPLSTATTLTFTATSGKRFVVWGVNAEEESSVETPSITASNVELPYDATSGEIEYTLNNPTPNGALSASTTAEWISDVTLLSNAAYVTFTTTANASAAQRTGTVTLTYTYGDNQTVTKNVTVTQAGNPNAVDNISDITSAGTYTVQGTIVAKSARGFIVGDGTGYVYYYNINYTQADYNIGDIVKLSGSVVVYGGVFEFNNSTTITAAQTSNYVAETPTLLTGADMDARVASTTPPALSTYVQYQGTLSIDGTHYNITGIDGATTAIGSISYPLNTDFTSLDGSTVIVEGYYVGISTSTYYNTMLGSITEVVTGDPSISASNVEIAYDVTSGEIEYTINNAVEDGVLTAATEAEWLSIGEVVTTVPFYCDPNTGIASRTATVTLTYTYGDDQTVTKNVTVTQAGNPDVINTISDITAEDTYTVQGTIVAKSTRGFIVGDGTGYVYYYNQNYTQADYNIGDMVRLSGSVVAYGGVFEFNASTTVTAANESNYEEDEPTVITGAEMDVRVASTTPAGLSAYVQYQGTLTINGTHYNITSIDGATTAQGSISYPLNTDFTSLDGHTVIVKGYYVGISSSTYYNTMLGSITEVAGNEPTITLDAYEVSVDAEDHEGTLTVTYTNIETDFGADIYWYDATGALVNRYDWIEAEIDGETLSYTIAANDGEARTAYFKVYGVGVDESDVYSNLVTVAQESPALPEPPHYTWDLTIASYNEVTNPAIVTWSSDYATMTNSSENGSTSASNYLGGDANGRTSSRFYNGNTLTIAPASGYAITSVVFSVFNNNSNYASALTGSTWTNATATASANNATVTVIPTDGLAAMSAVISGTCGFSAVTVYYEENNTPVIVANNVTVPYDATSGSIDYIVNNPVDGGVLTANTTADWITLQMTPNYAVTFTCEENEATEARTATVTLTYTYNTTETVSKNVTVTQEGAPAPATVYTTIPELFAAATGNETPVLVTFDSWIVSGVSTNGKNVFVTDGTNGFVLYYTSDMSETYAAGDILDGEEVACTLKLYNGFAELLNVNAEDLIIISGASELVPAEIEMAELSGVNTGALVSYENLTCSVNNNKYYLSDGTTTLQVYNSLYAFNALVADHIYNITGVYQQFNNTKEVLPRSAADIEEVISEEPSITVTPASINAPFEGTEGTLAITYENIPDLISFDIEFCDANGVALDGDDPDWILAEIQEGDETYSVHYVIDANDGEARTAYFKVYTFTGNDEEVYSNIVTVNQAQYVVDYATLPFEFDGGRADIANTVGLTHEGLDSDYSSSPKLKFKNQGSWLILHFNETPGTLTFDIKGNSFADGTFTVQTSEDGETYTDLETYTELSATQSETFNTLGANVRYIKWVYTEKVNGNVALGNIVLRAATDVPEQYDLTVSEFENLEIFTFVDDLNELALEGAGTIQVTENANVSLSVSANEGYIINSLVVDGENVTSQIDETGMYTFVMPSHNVTITATAIENVSGNWVLTDIADLTAEDIFVIVGTRTDATYGGNYAMPNDNGTSAPAAVSVTVVENTLSGEPADNLKWNLSITEDGYVFHPNGDTMNWLYCTNTNNGVKVGDGSAKHFSMSDGYLTTTETDDQRYIGLYNAQDWRCYTNTTGNIANQTFAFYKKVTSSVGCDKIVLDDNNEWPQNFDNVTPLTPDAGFTGKTMGDCWTWTPLVELPTDYADTMPQVFYRNAFAHNSDYSLVMWHRGVYAMPELDENIDINQLKMSFYVRQSYPFYSLLVGVMTDPTEPETFEPVAFVDNGTSTNVEFFEFNFANYQGEGRYIAFKNVRPSATSFDGQWNDVHSVNYIDDIELSLIEQGNCVFDFNDEEIFVQTFETVTRVTNKLTGVMPDCWELVQQDVTMPFDKMPQVYCQGSLAYQSNYSFRMVNLGIVAMPEMNFAYGIQNAHLSMMVRQPNANYQLQVGVWDGEEFVPVALVNNNTTEYEAFECDFSNYNGEGGRIAFRNIVGNGLNFTYSYNYLDDIAVEEIYQECNGIPVPHTENFDTYSESTVPATGVKPDCWEVVDNTIVNMAYGEYPQIYNNENFANSGSYTLRMTDRCVFAMPYFMEDEEISNLHLSMYLRQPNALYTLEVGVWDPQNAVFIPVATFDNPNSNVTFVECDFSNYEGPNYGRIAFRNTLKGGRTWNYSYNYIDDVTLDYYGNNEPVNRNNASDENVIDNMNVDSYLESIVVYPNPTVGELHIGAMDVQIVECYNQMGQLVAVYNNERDININNLADGVYTLRITVPQGVTMRKVVKK